MSASLDKLMRRITRLERRVDANAVPRLGNSSIDDGGAITVNNPDSGMPELIIGTQADGTVMTNHVSGPPPPQPSAPMVLHDTPGYLTISWDGLFEDSIAPPLDFSRVEVHASPDSGFTPDPTMTLKTTIESPRGGVVAVAVPYDQDTYVRLVARTLSGAASVPSDETHGVTRQIQTPDIAHHAVTNDSIADFILAVTKFKTLNHQIY